MSVHGSFQPAQVCVLDVAVVVLVVVAADCKEVLVIRVRVTRIHESMQKKTH